MPFGFATQQSADADEEDNMGGEEPGAAGLPEESKNASGMDSGLWQAENC